MRFGTIESVTPRAVKTPVGSCGSRLAPYAAPVEARVRHSAAPYSLEQYSSQPGSPVNVTRSERARGPHSA